tara:strand:+ start:275 stop:1531 length:1257 start_codon:yes stop_codon:yes gene_type:complete
MDLDTLIQLHNKGKYRILIAECEKLIRLRDQKPEIINLLGVAYKNLKCPDEALKVFQRGINEYPLSGAIWGNLGNLYLQQGKLEEAKKTLKKAIQINPDMKTFHDNLGLVFLEMGQLEKACDEFEAALQIAPKDIKTKLNLAHAHRKLNNLPKAIEYFEEIDQGLSQSHLTECLYLDGQNKKLLKKIEKFGNSKVSDPLIGAVTEHSRVTLNHSFCNSFCSRPLSYIYRANINNSGTAEKTFKDIEKFAYSKTCDYKSQSLLINGTQTSGNLLNLNEPFVKPLSGIIDKLVKAYRNKFKQSEEPFIKYWPNEYSIYAWIVLIQSKGFLKPHIHKEGWVSGSIYLKIPKRELKNEGAISFGLHGADYPKKDSNFREFPVEISERMVCMFPSSLFHKTVPTRSMKDRLSLAFDVIPNREI